MKHSVILVGLMMSALVIGGCRSDGDVDSKANTPIILTAEEQTVAERSNDFAYRLLQTVCKQSETDENIVFSPLSASCAIGMLASGTVGATQQELLDCLDLSGTDEGVNDYFMKLTDGLPSVDAETTVRLSNLVWLNEQYSAKTSFVDGLRTNFNADVMRTSTGNAANRVNEWCLRKTDGLIDGILNEVGDDASMMLFSAIYFKARWETEFAKSRTKKEEFTSADGTVGMVDMMNASRPGIYAHEFGLAVADFSYWNYAFSMQVILPDEGVSIDSACNALRTHYSELLALRNVYRLNIKFPKFSVTSSSQLTEPLQAMGVERCFGQNADFTNISDSRLSLNRILQKCTLSVDEEGTEAAAVTMEDMVSTPLTEFEADFFVNRPFLFLIVENRTGTVLFAGKIASL